MLLLDIETTDTSPLTRTDKEIMYESLGSSADTFVFIDTYMEYLDEFNSRSDLLSKRTNSKVLAEYLPIVVSELHSVKLRKESAPVIVQKGDVVISLPFAPIVSYKNKTFLGPINTPIKVKDFRLIPIFNISNNEFARSINKALPIEVDSISDIRRAVMYSSPCWGAPPEVPNGYSVNLEHRVERDELNFLISKPVSENPIHLRYSFDIDNKLALLEDVIAKGINANAEQLADLSKEVEAERKYQTGVSELVKDTARLSRLEHMCKVKFPNLFNKSSKEYMFGTFSLEAMPAKYKTALLSEYSNKVNLEVKLATNKCGHLSALVDLRKEPSKDNLKKIMQFESKDLTCGSCEMQLMCPHEADYFKMLLTSNDSLVNKIDRIEQMITTKYSDSKKSNMYASFCKLCGMKILDMKSNEEVTFDSNSMYGNKDQPSEDQQMVRTIAMRNLAFTKPVSKKILFGVVDSIWSAVSPVVSQMSGKKEVDKYLNVAVLVLTAIISISSKVDYITHQAASVAGSRDARIVEKVKKSNIVMKKTNVSELFRNALAIFMSRYSSPIKESSYKNKEELLKQLFVKAYKLIKDSVDYSGQEDNTTYTKTTSEDYANLKVSSNEYKIKSKEQFEVVSEGRNPDSMSFAEKKLIEDHIKTILYPYSHLPYSYSRYYKGGKWSKDMILYVCPVSGKRHSWGTYITTNEEYSIKKIGPVSSKDIIGMRCSECKYSTSELMAMKVDVGSIVKDKSELLNKIDSFYSVFKFRCLKAPFHVFVSKNNKVSCNVCSMDFDFIIKKDTDFYLKHSEFLSKHHSEVSYSKNIDIVNHKNLGAVITDAFNSIRLTSPSLKEVDSGFLAPSDKLLIENTGSSENRESNEITSKDISDGADITKMIDRLRQLMILVSIIANKPKSHKYSTNSKFLSLPDVNLSKLMKELIAGNIVETAWKTRDKQFIKSNILYILQRLSHYPEVLRFAVNAIKDSEEVFTVYDYAEIKKIFNLEKIQEESMQVEQEVVEIFDEIINDFGEDDD